MSTGSKGVSRRVTLPFAGSVTVYLDDFTGTTEEAIKAALEKAGEALRVENGGCDDVGVGEWEVMRDLAYGDVCTVSCLEIPVEEDC